MVRASKKTMRKTTKKDGRTGRLDFTLNDAIKKANKLQKKSRPLSEKERKTFIKRVVSLVLED